MERRRFFRSLLALPAVALGSSLAESKASEITINDYPVMIEPDGNLYLGSEKVRISGKHWHITGPNPPLQITPR